MEKVLNNTGSYLAEHFISKSMDSEAPIFLTGFARSGTTWVNHLFRDYFDAGFVNEGQFILTYAMRLNRYDDLYNPINCKRFLRDLAKDNFFYILMKNYDVIIDWERVGAVKPEFSAIVCAVLQQIAEQLGKRRIGSKYYMNERFVNILTTLFPRCRIVHVIRDGRDCALSHQGMTWGYRNVYSAAVHWRKHVNMLHGCADKMTNRYLEFRYEDLLLQPESTMRTLEHFITGTHDDSATRQYLKDNESISSYKVSKWRDAMSPSSQAIFEAVAGDTLLKYGYPLAGVTRHLSPLYKAGCIVYDRLYREGWYWAKKIGMDPSDWTAS